MRKRILHVISNDEGGAPRGAADLVRIVASNYDTVGRLCITSPAPEILPRFLNGVETVFLGLQWRLTPVQIKRHVDEILRQIEEFRPDLVHSHLQPADVASGFAAARARIPHVAHIRDTRPWLSSRRPADRIRKAVFRSAYRLGDTRFCAVSRAAADHAIDNLKLDRARVQVILNAINPVPFLAIQRELGTREGQALVVGAAGRFVEEKGFELLIRSVAAARLEGKSLRLRIAGRGSRRDSYIALAENLGIGQHVDIVPEIDDMAGFLATIDVFALPSLSSEGLSRVLLEAMAAGSAVVSTKVAGADEAVVDGYSGILVEPGNIGAMASALMLLESDRILAWQYGVRGRETVCQRHTLERLGREIAAVYEDCLALRYGFLKPAVSEGAGSARGRSV